MKRLIVNADDFGLSPGVNQGILKAHREGIVTSTTVMVNLESAKEIIQVAKRNPDLGIGIHLNITYGQPISPAWLIEELLEAGRFMRPDQLNSKLEPKKVAMEWEAQVGEFLSWGLLPSHLDSHHHVHCWPELRDIAVSIAKDLGVPVRFRNEETKRTFQQEAIKYSDYFVEDFYGPTATLVDLCRILAGLKQGTTEIMCHPAMMEPKLGEISSYADMRGQELVALAHPGLKHKLPEMGIELVNYGVVK